VPEFQQVRVHGFCIARVMPLERGFVPGPSDDLHVLRAVFLERFLTALLASLGWRKWDNSPLHACAAVRVPSSIAS
jgi:hypothetical protein